jgi:NADH-quinone oxidoreductase subunit J
MNVVFYISAGVAILSTLMVVSRSSAVHALLYLIVSLLSVAVVFYCLGAPFIAALEVIIYAGAIMVLFVFVIMMLNLGPHTARQERAWMRPRTIFGPALLAAVLLGEVVYVAGATPAGATLTGQPAVDPQKVGQALFGPYLIAVELASLLLLTGLVGACHLGRRVPESHDAVEDAGRENAGRLGADEDVARPDAAEGEGP